LAVPGVRCVRRWRPPPQQHPQLQQFALDAGQALAVSNEPGTARLQKATRQPGRHQPPTEWRPNDAHPALCGIGSASVKATLGIQQRVLGAIKAGAVLHAGQHTSCWSTIHNMQGTRLFVRTCASCTFAACSACTPCKRTATASPGCAPAVAFEASFRAAHIDARSSALRGVCKQTDASCSKVCNATHKRVRSACAARSSTRLGPSWISSCPSTAAVDWSAAARAATSCVKGTVGEAVIMATDSHMCA
jgi:hypothetical protein